MTTQAQTFRHTSHVDAVEAAFARHGFEKTSDGATEYQMRSRFRTMRFVLDGDTSTEYRVDFDQQGYVCGYSHKNGYAHTHHEGRQGRKGVWAPRFGPAACRDLLIKNLDLDFPC